METQPQSEIEENLFSAVLTPHRSLGPKGFLILISLVGLVSFTAGIVFLSKGAWPVFGFFGLDVFLVYIAFKLNYRAGRTHETINLTEQELKVTRVYPSGHSKSWHFNPYWVRLELLDGPSHRSALSLSSHGEQLIFGKFLTEDERKDFAEILGGALIDYRGGVKI